MTTETQQGMTTGQILLWLGVAVIVLGAVYYVL